MKLHATAPRRFSLSKNLGVDCSADGLTLAGVPLLRRTPRGFVSRDAREIRWLLEGAYGSIAEADRIIKSIERISSALNQGQFGQAMIRALLLDLPELDWGGAARLAQADDALTKYDEMNCGTPMDAGRPMETEPTPFILRSASRRNWAVRHCG